VCRCQRRRMVHCVCNCAHARSLSRAFSLTQPAGKKARRRVAAPPGSAPAKSVQFRRLAKTLGARTHTRPHTHECGRPQWHSRTINAPAPLVLTRPAPARRRARGGGRGPHAARDAQHVRRLRRGARARARAPHTHGATTK
jgi:hypothetical protein